MADSPITTPDDIATAVRAHAERIMRAAGSDLKHYTLNGSQQRILAAVMDCYEQAYRAGAKFAADQLERPEA